MPGKQLLRLLSIAATLSTLAVYFNHQSALGMSAAEVGQQQRGRETAQANSLQNLKIPESWLPRCTVAFIIGGYIIYSRKKRLK
jgi:hypothetical protein